MKRIFVLLSLSVLASAAAFAQRDDYKKGEFFVGYSNGQVDTGFDSDDLNGIFRENVFDNFNGFNASGVYNVSRYLGLKADVSGTYNRTEGYGLPMKQALLELEGVLDETSSS